MSAALVVGRPARKPRYRLRRIGAEATALALEIRSGGERDLSKFHLHTSIARHRAGQM